MNLGRIDWRSALSELKKGAASPDGKRRFAQAASLAARFAGSFDEGASHAREAARLEPLNPLHHVRFALHCLRYGQHERALAAIDAVPAVKDLPAVRTVRALATLQSDEDRRAANIARDLAAAHPTLVAAAFLQADAHLRPQLKEAEARSQTLPRDAKHSLAWTHLLVKRIVARPKEAAKVIKNHLEARPVLEKGSAHEALVIKAAAWSASSCADLAKSLAETRIGSKAEELVLSLYVEQLRDASDEERSDLAALHRAHLDRPAVRRVYVSELTRIAIEHATNERWHAALRVIEVAARLEPHEPVHVQNRAAVLTAMADDAQHEAWAELDRLHYRLVLAGCLDAEMARRIAKPHRMHAEQARLTPTEAPDGPAWGVFRVVEADEDGAKTRSLEVNQKRIDDDPEALRSYIHHRRAELVWHHLALGADARALLLAPSGPHAHRARVRALCIGAESLAALVPEEGRALADRIAKLFRALPVGRTHYKPDATPDDATMAALKLEYAQTVADFAVLAWRWQVDPKRADLVEELIDGIAATMPFLEEQALVALLAAGRQGELSNAGFLGMFVRTALGSAGTAIRIDDADRKRLAGRLAAELLVTLATRRLDASTALGRHDIERALSLVDRARDLDPSHARVEHIAARMCTIGEFYDEARACIARFNAIPGARETPFQQSIEETQRILDDKKKQNAAGNARAGSSQTAPGRAHQGQDEERERDLSRIESLEEEIEKFPSSVQLYEELARALAAAARFEDARSWCTRAIGRCLTRKAQVRARLLEVEIHALERLAPKHFGAVEVYLAGARAAALENVDAVLAEGPHYALHYLRGTCLLARRDRPAAEAAFRAALEGCSHQLHRAALRPLAEDVDGALLEQTRAAIESALAGGKVEDAMREAGTALAEARTPEAVLLDLSRVLLAAAVAAVGTDKDRAVVPTLAPLDPKRVAWSARLTKALADRSAVEQARAVASLAAELHVPSQKEAAVLLRRIEAFAEEIAFAETVKEATRLERRGDFAPALALLEGAGERARTDARALRLRAMLLLRLERFADAEEALEVLKASGHPSAKSLVDKWPELRFKLGLGAVTKKLREDAVDEAHALLLTLTPLSVDGELEHAYSLAFCVARIARRLHDAGDRGQALERMEDAVEILETKLATKEGAAHPRIRELRDRLDTDLGHMRGTAR